MTDVVHVYKDYAPVHGGVESHLDLLTRLLVERGLGVDVLCSRRPGTGPLETRAGVRVRRSLAPLELRSTPLTPGLPWALWRSSARLIHLHYPWPPGEAAWLLGGRGRPLVVTVHCEVVRYPLLARLLAPLTQQVLATARRIVVSSRALASATLLARHRGRVRIVPFGVDLERFRPGAPALDPLPGVPRPRVLFVGRLRHYKGFDVLVAALARLPAARLVVVGEGPERAGLEGALRAAGCRERAHLLGTVDDDRLLALLQTADAAVLTSTSHAEAFGLAIAEAQACGVPAVTTDVGTGTAATVLDGISGRVVPPHDPAALASALAWCLDPEQAPARRAAARRHAEDALCGRRMAAAVHAIYEEVAADAADVRAAAGTLQRP